MKSIPLFYRIIAPLNLLLGIVAAVIAVFSCFNKEGHVLIPYLSIGTLILLGSSFCWFFALPFARDLLFLTAVLLFSSVAAGNYCLLGIFEKNEPDIIIIEISVVLIVYALFCFFAAFSKSAIAWEKESVVSQSKVKGWTLVVLPTLLLFASGFWVLYELSTRKPEYETHENENYEEVATVEMEEYATPDTVRAVNTEGEGEEEVTEVEEEQEEIAPESKHEEEEEEEAVVEKFNDFNKLPIRSKPAIKESIDDVLKRAEKIGFFVKNIVHVSTVEEFVDAIKSNTTIIVKSGTYIFNTDKFSQSKSDKFAKSVNYRNVKNLTIIGEGNEPPRFLQSSKDAFALILDRINNAFISNIVFGHTLVTEQCRRGLVYFSDCNNIYVDNCTTYGSGFMVLAIDQSKSVILSNCLITDCSSFSCSFYQSQVVIQNTEFSVDFPNNNHGLGVFNTSLTLNSCILNIPTCQYYNDVEDNKSREGFFSFNQSISEDNSLIQINNTLFNGVLVNDKNYK